MMNLLQVQINIVLCVLLIIIFIHAYFNISRKKTINRLFLWILGLIWCVMVLEILDIVLNNPDLKQFIVLHKMVNSAGFILIPFIPFVGYMFGKEWASMYNKEKIKLNKILILPLLINAILVLISDNGRGLFHITMDNNYERGPLFFVLPCVTYLYIVYNLHFIYKQRKNFTHSELLIFTLFYFVPALATFIQLGNPTYLTIWNSTAIIAVLIYIFILNDQAYRDSLTGVGNRLSYEHYAQNIDHKMYNKLFMVYIDIDKFKMINDQYGHSEGDEAIKVFAKLLVESFPLRQKKVIRLGGDEFLVLIEEQNKEKALNYIKIFGENVEIYNDKSIKPYKLRFSYGMACYTNEYENIGQLLVYVDKLMYEQKQSKKIRV